MTVTSVSELLAAVADGVNVKYLFFWGHRARRDGQPGPGCLSQWWPSPFTIDGRTFATAEHWMMWSKAMLFGDTAVADRILAVKHPAEAKALGRQVAAFDEAVWRRKRFEIVVTGSEAKFGQDAHLRAFLTGTGEHVLVEASPTDRIWGIGLTADDPRAADPAHWRGQNLLGFALMAARERLAGDAAHG